MRGQASHRFLTLTRTATCFALLFTSCGASPRIWTSPEYQPHALGGILVAPLATSGELGDLRTGVILSDATRWTANAQACTNLAASLPDRHVVCLDIPTLARHPALSRIEHSFALDEPIATDTWWALRSSSGADLALLFRPENANSSQDVSHRRFSRTAGSQNDVLSCPDGPCLLTKNETELEYLISARLVDMRTGRTLRTGSYSDRASRTVPRNLGYAEPPPSEILLVRIMVKLGSSMLAD